MEPNMGAGRPKAARTVSSIAGSMDCSMFLDPAALRTIDDGRVDAVITKTLETQLMNNAEPKPFVWTESADAFLASIE
jgi:hypothetical protein